LASEKIASDRVLQVHDAAFRDKSGGTLEAITVNDATNEDGSGSGVEVYVISTRLGGGQ
jgi:hypothetical protein